MEIGFGREVSPFHERQGEWWRFSEIWVNVSRIRAEVKDAKDFVDRTTAILAKRLNPLGVGFVSDDVIEGEEHALVCALHAVRRASRGCQRTRNIGLDLLLYASGTRHVSKALDNAGIKDTDETLWIAIFMPSCNGLIPPEDIASSIDACILEKEWRTAATPTALETASRVDL